MARPNYDRRNRKQTQELIGERDLYRAIKQHKEAVDYNLTMEQIRAVFRAYADIVHRGLINSIRITLPYMGEFFKATQEGFKGGMMKIPDKGMEFKKGCTFHEEYFPAKPDYGIMRFEVRNALQEKFKEETVIK